MTEVGLSVLFKERLELVEGRSVGLITNQTGIDPQFRRNLTLFAEHPRVELAAIFSPEHGVAGSAQAGIQIASAIGKGGQIPSTASMEKHGSLPRRCLPELMRWYTTSKMLVPVFIPIFRHCSEQ